MRIMILMMAVLMGIPFVLGKRYSSPSIDIVYVLSVKGNDTICLAAERPAVEFEKEKKSLWKKVKEKTSETVDKAKDAAVDKGWIDAKPGDTVAAPDPTVFEQLDSVPLIRKSFQVKGEKSTCVAEKGQKHMLVVRSNHSYTNPRELVQILPIAVSNGIRLYHFPTEANAPRPFQYCDKVEPYDNEGSYICYLDLPAGEYAVTVADQPTLVQFFSIPE